MYCSFGCGIICICIIYLLVLLSGNVLVVLVNVSYLFIDVKICIISWFFAIVSSKDSQTERVLHWRAPCLGAAGSRRGSSAQRRRRTPPAASPWRSTSATPGMDPASPPPRQR